MEGVSESESVRALRNILNSLTERDHDQRQVIELFFKSPVAAHLSFLSQQHILLLLQEEGTLPPGLVNAVGPPAREGTGLERTRLKRAVPKYDTNPISEGTVVIPAQFLWMLQQQQVQYQQSIRANFQQELNRQRDNFEQQLQRERDFSERDRENGRDLRELQHLRDRDGGNVMRNMRNMRDIPNLVSVNRPSEDTVSTYTTGRRGYNWSLVGNIKFSSSNSQQKRYQVAQFLEDIASDDLSLLCPCHESLFVITTRILPSKISQSAKHRA